MVVVVVDGRVVVVVVVVVDDVVARLQERPGLDVDLRSAALALATARLKSADELNNAAWRVARSPGLGPAAYTLSLRRARAAAAREPEDASILNTLGAALYRSSEEGREVEVG